MNLYEVKLNTPCIIKQLEIEDEKLKIRLMELGLTFGTKLMVKNKSVCKKTLLVVFNNSCFSLKEQTAKLIMVNYV